MDTFGITVKYAVDMCDAADALPLQFRDRLFALSSGADAEVWRVLHGCVHFNLFAVVDACLRDGLAPRAARDSHGRNVIFYATFGLINNNYAQWLEYFIARGATPCADACGLLPDAYLLTFGAVYNVDAARVAEAVTRVHRAFSIVCNP